MNLFDKMLTYIKDKWEAAKKSESTALKEQFPIITIPVNSDKWDSMDSCPPTSTSPVITPPNIRKLKIKPVTPVSDVATKVRKPRKKKTPTTEV